MAKILELMALSEEGLKSLLENGFCVESMAYEDVHVGEVYAVYNRTYLEIEVIGVQRNPRESHIRRVIFKKVEPQMSMPSQPNLTSKKERALMIVVEMIIAREQNRAQPDERIFKLFELAKRVFRAEDKEELKLAIDELIKS